MKIFKIYGSIGHYCYNCGSYVRYDPCENCGN